MDSGELLQKVERAEEESRDGVDRDDEAERKMKDLRSS